MNLIKCLDYIINVDEIIFITGISKIIGSKKYQFSIFFTSSDNLNFTDNKINLEKIRENLIKKLGIKFK